MGEQAEPPQGNEEGAAGSCDPAETLRLVERAASLVRALRNNADFVSLCTQELLARTREERTRLQSENQELRRLTEEIRQQLVTCETELSQARTAAQAEGERRAVAEIAAFQARHRALMAEQRCKELEAAVSASEAHGMTPIPARGGHDPIAAGRGPAESAAWPAA